MGRGKYRKGRGGGRGGRGGGGGGSGAQKHRDGRGDWNVINKSNEKLERYYSSILHLSDEEKEAFWTALRGELPNSFRFCGSKGHALAVRRLLHTRYIPQITEITHEDGRTVEPPLPVDWYPDSLAWWMTTPKNIIRRFPPFAAFQKFLVSETSVGNISRQEVVSMIPPLLMDVRPGMAVLDLCAAPGSKSAQLLEMIHHGEEARIRQFSSSMKEDNGQAKPEEGEEDVDLSIDSGDDGRATGLLIANDADYKRCHMLTHQLKRLSSPNILVTNHDATLFPSIMLPPTPNSNGKRKTLKFDRILCDVPCSGDGTLRKNVALWKDWAPGNALGLHLVQVRILVRALQMLKVGGRVVYSTCSMNPIENESVVVTAIERCGGLDKVDIIDCSDQLPLLKRKPGIQQWQIMDKSGRIWNSWKDVEDWTNTEGGGVVPGRVTQSMFPRPDGDECANLPLDRCMRVYAHQQDTGGFFITVLQKKKDVKVKNETSGPANVGRINAANGKAAATPSSEAAVVEIQENAAAPSEASNASKRSRESEDDGDEVDPKRMKTEDTEEDSATPQEAEEADAPKKQGPGPDTQMGDAAEAGEDGPKGDLQVQGKKIKGPHEEPFKYLSADHPVLQNIREFYKVSPRFPDDRYMVRNALGEPSKAIYYTSGLIRDILVENEGRGVKFIHGGVKMFVRQDAPSAEVCRWRIQSEGMPILQGYVGPERIIYLHDKETLRKLLIEMFPRIADGAWENLGEIGPALRDIGMGCCVLRVEPDGSDEAFSEKMALPLWKSIMSANLMLPKEDRSAMLLRIFNDTTPLVNNGLQKGKKKDEAGGEEEEDEKGLKEELPGDDVASERLEDAPSPDEAQGEEGAKEETSGAKAENKDEDDIRSILKDLMEVQAKDEAA